MNVFVFLKKAFSDMKASAAAQYQVDKAQFEAVKAESRAHFEENRGHNTFARAKAESRQHWDEAHMRTEERKSQMQKERVDQLEAAEARIAAANARYEAARR